jgi:hypothetical protein
MHKSGIVTIYATITDSDDKHREPTTVVIFYVILRCAFSLLFTNKEATEQRVSSS